MPQDLEKNFEQKFLHYRASGLRKKVFWKKKNSFTLPQVPGLRKKLNFFKFFYPLCPSPRDLEKNFDEKFLYYEDPGIRKLFEEKKILHITAGPWT